jgi:hypothetical protein
MHRSRTPAPPKNTSAGDRLVPANPSLLANPLWRALATRIQPRLTVNQPGDEYEREADRVADLVTRMPVPAGGAVPALRRKCAACDEELQAKGEPGAARDGSPVPAARIQQAVAEARPLPDAARHWAEPRFGADFGGVRVSTGSAAAGAARAVHARAFTLGSSIVFAPGEFAPESAAGRRLLAHELTHTLQQGQGDASSLIQRRPDYLVDNYKFLGNTVGGGLNPKLKGKLEQVETDLKAQFDALGEDSADRTHFGGEQKTFKEWTGIYSVRSWRSGSSTSKHASGSAVDVNYDVQPYIATRTEKDGTTVYGGEAAGANLQAERKAAVEVYDRAIQFEFSDPAATADVSARKTGESATDAYKRMRTVDQALRYYFRRAFSEEPKSVTRAPIKDIEGASEEDLLKAIPTAERRDETTAIGDLETLMKGEWFQKTHPNWPLTARQQYFRILRDYEHVRIPMVMGKPVARPGQTRNPTRGFMNMRREFVVAMMDTGGLRWGAVDLGAGESGDVHHFDLGNHGGYEPDGTE